MGGYSTAVTAVVILIALVINLIVAQLPETITKLDTSGLELYTITEATEKALSGIDENITIYLVASSGSEDGTLLELLGRYEALSSKIKVETVDPVKKPNFTSQYTDGSVTANSLIIESERRYTIVDYDKIYYYEVYIDGSYIGSCTESEYQSLMMMYYSYYGVTPTAVPVMNAEGAITGAIKYTLSDYIPKVYMLSGHGESSLDATYSEYMNTDNIDISESFQLLTAGAVPEDATCVMINNPTSDIAENEAELLKSFVANGGNIILITFFRNFTTENMPNLVSLMEYYGMTVAEGMIIEGNSNNYYPNYPYYLLPKLNSSPLTESLDSTNIYVLMPNSHGINISSELRSGLTVYPILNTTAQSYIKLDPDSTTTKEDGDVEGPFYVGAAAVEGNSKVVWYSSPGIELSAYDITGGNSTIFMSTINWVCQNQTESLSIATKQLQVEALTIPELQANIWSVIIIVLIPASFIVAGLVVYIKRRRA